MTEKNPPIETKKTPHELFWGVFFRFYGGGFFGHILERKTTKTIRRVTKMLVRPFFVPFFLSLPSFRGTSWGGGRLGSTVGLHEHESKPSSRALYIHDHLHTYEGRRRRHLNLN